MFTTVTPNETGNVTVAYFSGAISIKYLERVQLNDVSSNAQRIEIAGKDPVACDLFFTSIINLLIGDMIGFDWKTKMPKINGGLFGLP